jgi:hypothetical protein
VSEPVFERVRARDVVPYEWAAWRRVAGLPEPLLLDVVGVRPSENGAHWWLMLENHTFVKARLDEELELVPRLPFAEELPDGAQS